MPRFLSLAQTGPGQRHVHAVLTGPLTRRLVISSLPGLRADGSMPVGLDAQIEQALENLAGLLAASGLKGEDLIAIAAYVAEPGARGAIDAAAAARIPNARPRIAVRHVLSLARADCLIEIDAEAAVE